jgi:relaxase-like protein
MPRRVIDVGRGGSPLLDIASYGRRGPGRRDRLSPAEVEQIARTVRRAPEVMIKVLTKGGQDFGAIRRHLAYLTRGNEFELETDDGERLKGKVAKGLMENWDLDLESRGRRSTTSGAGGRPPLKLVHKLIFSMPPGTPPDRLMAAVRNFAREEFALKHRYATVLHTDEPHPHAHMVVKAVSEQGVRLNIRKATLREWRQKFARHLRAQGVAANATERAVRGENRACKLDGIYRAQRRGESTHTGQRVAHVARELLNGGLRVESGKVKLLQTRGDVERGWRAIRNILLDEGRAELAHDVARFLHQMPPPRTEKELVAQALRAHIRDRDVRR